VTDIDLTPDVVNIKAYAGNTVPILVTVPAGVADGFMWNGQLRTTRESATVDATWIITEPVAPGDPAYCMLPAAETARLAGTGTVTRRRMSDGTVRSIQVYSGEYDIECKHPTAPDPVHTWVQGTLTIELDVTRVEVAP
jgi:hypothetical protein